jgi:hypothetical protein
MEERKFAFRILLGKPEEKDPLGRPRLATIIKRILEE